MIQTKYPSSVPNPKPMVWVRTDANKPKHKNYQNSTQVSIIFIYRIIEIEDGLSPIETKFQESHDQVIRRRWQLLV